MKIVDVRTRLIATRRVYATTTAFLHAAESEVHRDSVSESWFVIIEVTDDQGNVGLGEISDIPPESLGKVQELHRVVREQLIGADASSLTILTERNAVPLDVRDDGTTYDILNAGLDGAALDLMAKAQGVSIADMFGGRVRDEVSVSWVAFIRDADSLEAEIQAKIDQGFRAFKLKVGLDPELDRRRVEIFRRLCGDDVHLKLDANSAWKLDDAVEQLRVLQRWGVDGVETPIAYLDIEGKRELYRRTGVPVIEHVHDVEFATALISREAVQVINCSTVGAGGIRRAREVLDFAHEAGVPCLLGSTVELGIGTAGQIHLAASHPAVTWPSDLVGPWLYTDEIVSEPFNGSFAGGCLPVPEGPGLGVALDVGQMERLGRDQEGYAHA
jgi:L-alanine-DL-glutamate epimerase-like enolase superfamily enzyme